MLGRLTVHCIIVFILQSLCDSAIESPRCSKLVSTTKHRVAIAFYGLSRSLKNTLPSFEQHVFKVLDNSSISYDVFWSGVHASFVNNKRSGEEGLQIDSCDFSLMRPCVLSLTSQSLFAPKELQLYKQARNGTTQNGVYDDASIRNLLTAFYSMRVLASMISQHATIRNITYDAVVVLRPDTAVVVDIDLPDHIDEIKREELKYVTADGGREGYSQAIWIPDYQAWGGYNDRAAYGSARVISQYLMRGLPFRDNVGVGNASFYNSEVYLKAYLTAHNITVHPSTLRVVRVRVNGVVAPLDTKEDLMNMTAASYQTYVTNCLYHPNTAPASQIVNKSAKNWKPLAYFNGTHC